MQEITDEEIEVVEGGAAGYGNIQFVCACGAEFLSESAWYNHLGQMRHKTGTAYYQQVKGKNSKGAPIGTVKANYNSARKSITLTYPNGWKTQAACAGWNF